MSVQDRFRCPALQHHPHSANLTRILRAALQAADPSLALERNLKRTEKHLLIGNESLPLNAFRRIRALTLGKSAASLALSLHNLLGDRLERGLMINKHPARPPGNQWQALTGGHPLPDANSLRAGRAAAQLVDTLDANDLLLCLISGGGSALMSWPRLALPQWRALHQDLLASGAPIQDINTIRRHLDALKGGGLAQRAAPARVFSLIFSDVIGNQLEAIASGPTAPDPTSLGEAQCALARWLPDHPLLAGFTAALRETPKPGAACFQRVQNRIIADNALVVQAAVTAGRQCGYHARSLGSGWTGEARQVAGQLITQLPRFRGPRPLLLAAGGETTVSLPPNAPPGGRNLELALAAVPALATLPHTTLITLATDGEDGTTDAAGALVTSHTLAQAQKLGLSADDFLARHDAWTFFARTGSLLRPGPTGANLNDLFLLFHHPPNHSSL